MRKVCTHKIIGKLEADHENRSQKKTSWRIWNGCVRMLEAGPSMCVAQQKQAEGLFSLCYKVH